ncbi:MAG: carbohydrate ABC transporter permease [Chloroflexota bacterium]|nr:carbohydrate ABC transporter permease [Chloroflexota bacterium]
MKRQSTLSSTIVYTVLIAYSVVIALPLVWMVTSSLKTTRELFSSPFSPPVNPQWGNFIEAWNSGIARYLFNSLAITVISVVLIVIVSGMAAYALARMQFPGRIPLYLLLIAGFAIPVHTTLVPLYRLLNNTDLLNTYAGVIGPYVAFGIPFSVLLMFAFFVQFPSEIEDAARIDGCSTWQMIFRVVLPLSLPSMASVALFQTVLLWNEFSLAIIVLNDDALRTIPLGLSQFQGQWTTAWPLLLSALTLASVPMLIIFVLMQKQFINTLSGFSK